MCITNSKSQTYFDDFQCPRRFESFHRFLNHGRELLSGSKSSSKLASLSGNDHNENMRQSKEGSTREWANIIGVMILTRFGAIGF